MLPGVISINDADEIMHGAISNDGEVGFAMPVDHSADGLEDAR